MYARGFKSWCERVALQQRTELSLRPEDPLDPMALAGHLGVVVWTADQVPGLDPACLGVLIEKDPESWSAITLCTGAKDLIIVNPAHDGGRRASDIMHEIAHILIGHDPARVDVTEDGLLMLSSYDKQQEEEAKWLSGCLLLPREALLLIRRRRMDPETAARSYGVSGQMLTFRQRVLNLVPQPLRTSKAGLIRH
ncbi:MAG: ImmA/IrrE family metallo-endopeptidase [Acidobacteriota bacterium]|nr:ImmA/IrrE family metallo-endopeptidase [Acidobacteriota bacterium]